MKYDTAMPLVDQLADAAISCEDTTTRYLLTVVRSTLDDHIEGFFINPSGDNLQALIGFWTRSVKLLKDTPLPTSAQSRPPPSRAG